MKSYTHKIFPTAVLEIRDFITEEERSALYKKIKQEDGLLAKHRAIDGEGSKSSHQANSNFITDMVLANRIGDAAKQYADETGIKLKGRLGNSWFNVQKKGSILNKHSHPLSVLSGALYIKTDEKSNDLCFFNPNYTFLSMQEYFKDSFFNYEWLGFHPHERSLFLFPSILMHGSAGKENLSDERIVISFNLI